MHLFFKLTSPGGRPGAGYLLLRGQKKLTEEKAAPASRPLRGFPVLLAVKSGSKKLARRMNEHVKVASSDSFSPKALFTTATARRLTRGPKGEQSRELIFRCGERSELKTGLKFTLQPSHHCPHRDAARCYPPCEPLRNTGEFGVVVEELSELATKESVT